MRFPCKKFVLISVVATAVIATAIIAMVDYAAKSSVDAVAKIAPEIGSTIAERYGKDLSPLVVVEDGHLVEKNGSDKEGPALLKTWFCAVEIATGQNSQKPSDGWGRPFCQVVSAKSLVLISQGVAPDSPACNANSIPEQLLLDMPRNKLIRTSGGHLVFITDRKR